MTARYKSVAALLLTWFCSILLFSHEIHAIFHAKSCNSFISPRRQTDTVIPSYGGAQELSKLNCSTFNVIDQIVRKTIPGRPPEVSH